MRKRQKMTRGKSRRNFSKGTKVNKKNALKGIMRGGIRL